MKRVVAVAILAMMLFAGYALAKTKAPNYSTPCFDNTGKWYTR